MANKNATKNATHMTGSKTLIKLVTIVVTSAETAWSTGVIAVAVKNAPPAAPECRKRSFFGTGAAFSPRSAGAMPPARR